MLKRQAFLRNPSSCQPYLTGKEMRAQKGEQTTWNDLHASVWQVTSKHSNFRVSTEFLQKVLIAALLCPSLISSGCDILWKKKKKLSWSLGWDFWGSQRESLSALDDRYDRGTQKAILCMNLRAEPRVISKQSLSFGAIHIFFWVTGCYLPSVREQGWIC